MGQGFEVVGYAEHHRLHLPAVPPRRIDTDHGVERAATNLQDGEEVTFSKLALCLFTDVIGQAAFGADFGLSTKSNGKDDGSSSTQSEASSEFIKMHLHATTSLKMDLSGSLSIIVGQLLPFLHQPFRQVLTRIPGSADREIDRVNNELSSQMDGIVADRIAAAARSSEQHKDLLSVVLAAKERAASARELLTPDYLSGLTYEHLLAGSATTSFTLSCTVYLIAKHPEVEEKLLREIDAFGPPDRVPTADDLQTKFPYLDQARIRIYIIGRPFIYLFILLALLIGITVDV